MSWPVIYGIAYRKMKTDMVIFQLNEYTFPLLSSHTFSCPCAQYLSCILGGAGGGKFQTDFNYPFLLYRSKAEKNGEKDMHKRDE